MQTLAQIRQILEVHGLSPRHALGQNFLVDHNLLRRLVDAAQIAPGGTVLEVGPGTGTLTEELLERGARVVACELDDSLADVLAARLGSRPGFTLVRGDCLAGKRAVNPEILRALHDAGSFKLVANLPYGAATPLMLALLTSHPACVGMWVTVQDEVADRLVAKPGTDAYGTISVVAAALAEGRKIARLPPECFWPRPEVTSAMAQLVRRPEPMTDDPVGFAEFCQKLFMQRRKQLGSTLKGFSAWPEGVVATDRAEKLPPERLIALFESVRRAG